MRKYRVYYWKEINDESVDLEWDLKANDIHHAYTLFHANVRVFKRIYKIEEI